MEKFWGEIVDEIVDDIICFSSTSWNPKSLQLNTPDDKQERKLIPRQHDPLL